MRCSRQEIEQELRRRIQDGVYAIGARMPSHRQLQTDLGASSVTLQRAFNRLVEQGYVERRGAQGTFVATTLPNHSCIALVFAEDAGKGQWNRFWSTLKRVGEDWHAGSMRFRSYHMGGQRADAPDHQRLCRDLADGGLGGVVFITPPIYLGDSPVFKAPVPRISISAGGPRDRDRFGCSVVEFHDGGVMERLLAGFATAGRSRLAVLSGLGGSPHALERCKPFLRPFKLETRPEWWLELPMDSLGAVCARGVARLLFSLPERTRPDCLLITDDNLVIPATAGVLDAGVNVPQELTVAAHANFPGPTRSAVPCRRYGPDLDALFATLIGELEHLANGGARRAIRIPVTVHDSASLGGD